MATFANIARYHEMPLLAETTAFLARDGRRQPPQTPPPPQAPPQEQQQQQQQKAVSAGAGVAPRTGGPHTSIIFDGRAKLGARVRHLGGDEHGVTLSLSCGWELDGATGVAAGLCDVGQAIARVCVRRSHAPSVSPSVRVRCCARGDRRVGRAYDDCTLARPRMARVDG